GNDPDSYIQQHGSAKFSEYLNEQAEDFIFFKTKILLGENGDDPIRKSETVKDIVESIALIPDEIKVSIFIRDCSKLLDIEERVLLLELNRIRSKNAKKSSPPTELPSLDLLDDTKKVEVPEDNTLSTLIRQEEECIRVLLLYGEIVPN